MHQLEARIVILRNCIFSSCNRCATVVSRVVRTRTTCTEQHQCRGLRSTGKDRI